MDSLLCCSPWGHKESDTNEWLNLTEYIYTYSWITLLYTWNIVNQVYLNRKKKVRSNKEKKKKGGDNLMFAWKIHVCEILDAWQRQVVNLSLCFPVARMEKKLIDSSSPVPIYNLLMPDMLPNNWLIKLYPHFKDWIGLEEHLVFPGTDLHIVS